jgi:hypothetical protein
LSEDKKSQIKEAIHQLHNGVSPELAPAYSSFSSTIAFAIRDSLSFGSKSS